MDVEQKGLDVATGGAAQFALAALADDACAIYWPPCSTLLARLTTEDACVDPVSRLRTGGRAAPLVLLSTVLNSRASTNSRIQAAECLISIMVHPDCGVYAVGTLQGAVVWGDFRDELIVGQDTVLKGYIARVAMHLLSKVHCLYLSPAHLSDLRQQA